MLRDLTFSAAAAQQILELNLRRQCLDLLIHAVDIRENLCRLLCIEMDIQLQHRLDAEYSLFPVEILSDLDVALSQTIPDIRDHILPAALTFDHAAERHRVLIPERPVIVPFSFIQEKCPHLSLNGDLFVHRLKLYMVKGDLVPDGLKNIRQISGQLQLFLHPENILFLQSELRHRIHALAVLHRFVMVDIHRCVLILTFLCLQSEGNDGLHAELPGIDQSDRKILDHPVDQDRVSVADALHIDLFLKGNRCLHACTGALHIRQVQDRDNQSSLHVHRVFSCAYLLQNDIALAAEQAAGVRLVI